MKKAKRIFTLMLVFCMLLCACTERTSNSNNGIVVTDNLNKENVLVGNLPCTFPLVKEDTTLNIMSGCHNDENCKDIYVWQKYQEMTGVNVDWITVSKKERSEKVASALMNQNDLDLIMRCKVSASMQMQYGENGLLLDLTQDDLLRKYAPNCWAYLQSHPDTLSSVMNPDGSIYSLPQVNSGAELRVSRKIFVNKTWLANVNMNIPTTTEEFYQLLKAFKEQDPNGNGDYTDEIPLCSPDWLSIQDCLYGSFGLANRDVHNQLVDCNEETGKVRLLAASDDYKEYLSYMNKLYSEGLLDSYITTITIEQWTNNAENDRIGVFCSTNLASLPADTADNWVAIEEPLEGPNGDKLCSSIRANFHSTGAALIPASCDNPALVLQWLDYFWTDEGTLFYHMGLEGETFTVNEDGTFDYMPEIYDEIASSGGSFDDVIAAYSPYVGGGNPTVEVAPYFMGGEMAKVPSQAARKLFEYGPKEYWPTFTFTPQENERLTVIQNDITKYISEMKADFITGRKSFDEWDNYKVQLNKLGEAELLAIYQQAVDRYHALTEVQAE